MRINLERKHIDIGIQNCDIYCPIAIALAEKFDDINNFIGTEPEDRTLSVYQNAIWIGHHDFDLSNGVRKWIETFDENREEVESISLHLTEDMISLIEEVRKDAI